MSERPSFGFVVPVGAHPSPHLGAALRSLVTQDVPIRIALCTVAPATVVGPIVDAVFADCLDKLVYRRHGPDTGQSAAINEGWAVLDTDILAWLNDDDSLLAGTLARVADIFRDRPDIDIVHGDANIVDVDGHRSVHRETRPVGDDFGRANVVAQPSTFARASAVRNAGGVREDLHYVMDWDLWLRLRASGSLFCYVPDVLSEIRASAQTKTAQFNTARYGEIYRLVRASSGRVAALKSCVGFAIGHFADYGPFRGPFSALRTRIQSGRARGSASSNAQLTEDGTS